MGVGGGGVWGLVTQWQVRSDKLSFRDLTVTVTMAATVMVKVKVLRHSVACPTNCPPPPRAVCLPDDWCVSATVSLCFFFFHNAISPMQRAVRRCVWAFTTLSK